MKLKSLLLITTAAFVQACGAALLKSAISGKQYLLIALAMAVFCGGFSLYYKGLSKLRLFIAQPLFSATMFLSTTLISLLCFKDSISVHQVSGIICIIGGMVVMGNENNEHSVLDNKKPDSLDARGRS